MFETLELQNLNKLVERKIGDFPSPKPFHSVKVQGLGHNRIKPFTQVGRPFVVPVFALVGYLPIETGEFADSTPPIVRTFDLTRKTFIEFPKFGQGLFQGLWMLNLLTVTECQIGFHTEVYSYALTCSRIGFGRGIISYNIQPKCANCVAKDLDIADSSFPFTVLVEREPTLVELKGLRGIIPRFERQSDTPFLKKVRRLELRRTVAIFAFELRQSTETVKKPVIRDVDTDDHFVKCITRDPCPMLLGTLEQLRQVRLQAKTTCVFSIDAVISLLKTQEVVVDVAKVVKHIAQAFVFWMFAQLILVYSARAFLFSLFHGFHVSRL